MKTFVLGIDGGSWRILDELELPGFQRLTSGGTVGELTSSLPPITYPAWKCYSTGKNPGKLGVFGFVNFDRERQTNRQNDSTHFDSPELWDYLSDEGDRVGVVNMPTTYPPHEVNGVMIAGPNSGDSGLVYPEEREPELLESGYVPLSSGHRLAFKSGGEKTISTAKTILESRFGAARQLLTDEEFDFFNLTIYCTDPVQHHFWDQREVFETYRSIDRELQDLLTLLDEDDDEWNVVVVSDHGFQPIRGAVYLDTWLEQQGFLERRQTADTDPSLLQQIGVTKDNAAGLVRALGVERVVDLLPESLVQRVNRSLPSEGGISVVNSTDWDCSDAVFLMGGIYVLNESRRDEIMDEIERELLSFRDDGHQVIDEVHRTDDVYNGPYTDAAPDLIPISDDYKLLGLSVDGSLFDPENAWIAAHEMSGVFVGHGPAFQDRSEVTLDIQDVAPTLLHAMERPVPNDVDGSVRDDILSDRVEDVVQWRDPLSSGQTHSASSVSEEEVKETLKQLGYIE
ncbi:alkaline phosphatase family protein [Halorientalis marina]|uniref:alkaline phosphatase family protein n=1 Tax=Halorientalis marina TaxID=2931976 RepID=UPI001FF6297D|nr:alkaline phosphatase family protein [Halorientalis marina]